MAATPGRSLPSSSSRLAPPPVETHEMRSARPSSLSARTESAPPTTVNAAALPATASATAFVPAAKRDHSNTPIGPFQKIVFAAASRSANAARVSGPMSSPSQPLGRSSTAYARLRVRLERSGADDVGRQLDVEVEGILDAQLLRHLPADEHRVGAPAEVAEHAELV